MDEQAGGDPTWPQIREAAAAALQAQTPGPVAAYGLLAAEPELRVVPAVLMQASTDVDATECLDVLRERAMPRDLLPLVVDPELRGLVLAAGRRVPVGLPSERRAQREADRVQAIAALAAALDGPRSAELERAVLEGLSRRAALEEGEWCAFALAVGACPERLAAALPAVVAELDPSPHTRRGAAARRALFEACGAWLRDGRQAAEFLGPHSRAPEAGVRARLAVEEARRLRLLRELWALEPARALGSLAATGPGERALAAEMLAGGARAAGESGPSPGRASTGSDAGDLDARALEQLLIDCAELETDPVALCAQLEALVALLQGPAAGTAELAATRALLERGVRHAPLELAICLGRAIAGMPRDTPAGPSPGPQRAAQPGPAESDSGPDNGSGQGLDPSEVQGALLPPVASERDSASAPDDWGVALLVQLLERVSSAAERDSDLAIGLLEAARTRVRLGSSNMNSPGDTDSLAEAPSGSSRERLSAQVLHLISVEQAGSELRLAAVAAMRDLARVEDVSALAELLPRGELDPAFGYALLGVLGHLVEREGAPAEAPAVVARCARRALSSSQVDLRREALRLLARDALQSELTEIDELDDLARAALREQDRDLVDQLLVLLAERGGPTQLELLLSGGLVRQRLAETPESAALLMNRLQRMAGGSRALRLEVASKILERVDGPARALLLGDALESVLNSPAGDAAQALEPPVRRRLLAYALELERLESRWAPLAPDRAVLFERVVEQLLEPLPPAEQPSALERALLLGAAGAAPESVERELRAAADADLDPSLLELVRAQLMLRAARPAEALEAYRDLVETRAAAATSIQPLFGGADSELSAASLGVRCARLRERAALEPLAPGDLRAVLELSEGELGSEDPAIRRAFAAGAGLALLNHPSWIETDVDSALVDLERIAAAVMADAWPEGRARLAEDLESGLTLGARSTAQETSELPSETLPNSIPAPTEPSFWRELVAAGEPRLVELLERARAGAPASSRDEPAEGEPEVGEGSGGESESERGGGSSSSGG